MHGIVSGGAPLPLQTGDVSKRSHLLGRLAFFDVGVSASPDEPAETKGAFIFLRKSSIREKHLEAESNRTAVFMILLPVFHFVLRKQSVFEAGVIRKAQDFQNSLVFLYEVFHGDLRFRGNPLDRFNFKDAINFNALSGHVEKIDLNRHEIGLVDEALDEAVLRVGFVFRGCFPGSGR